LDCPASDVVFYCISGFVSFYWPIQRSCLAIKTACISCCVRANIDDLLVLSKGSFEDHLLKLELVLQHLQKAGLKVNAKKSFFVHPELEYLGYVINRDGMKPSRKKVEAIQNIAEPKTRKQLRGFIGFVNYYRDMWIRRSHVLAPLSELCSKNVTWKWTEAHRKAFNEECGAVYYIRRLWAGESCQHTDGQTLG
jgi:hypothetical protein